MDSLHAFYLAILQGLTEFLPISSSAHLILMPYLLDWQLQDLYFDVAVHLGTLLAVLCYFRKDLIPLASGGTQYLAGNKTPEGQLMLNICLASIPVMFFGLIGRDFISEHLRNPTIIATTTILFGLLLAVAHFYKGNQDEHSLNWKMLTIIAFSQALALIPGVSRSGVTITAGVLVGLTKEAALRFSFLLAIPVISAAVSLELVKIAQQPASVDWSALGIGITMAFICAYITIKAFFAWLDKIGFMPFVVYRLALGALLFWLI